MDDQDIIEASQMKFRYKKESLSFTDCLGYVLAKKNHLKFLTGDNQFEHKENVEFVK